MRDQSVCVCVCALSIHMHASTGVIWRSSCVLRCIGGLVLAHADGKSAASKLWICGRRYCVLLVDVGWVWCGVQIERVALSTHTHTHVCDRDRVRGHMGKGTHQLLRVGFNLKMRTRARVVIHSTDSAAVRCAHEYANVGHLS